MSEVIDVIGPTGGVMQIDGDKIARIIASHTNCSAHTAEKTTKRIIKYLIEVIVAAERAKTQ